MVSTAVQGAAPNTERRAILQLGLPFLVGVLSSSIDGVIDTAMMGHYGVDALAAVASASAVFDVFTTVAVATVVGHQILSARFAGREDGAGVRDSMRATAKLSAAVVLPLAAICFLFGGVLTEAVSSGASQDVQMIGGHFLMAVAPTLALAAAFTALTATFNAYKLVRQPMLAGLVVAGSNVVLDWLLIYGPGPFPRLGAVGNGLGTTFAWLLGLLFLVVLTFRAGLWQKLRTTTNAEPADFEKSVTKLSWPAMMSSGLDYASTAVFFGVVGGLGATALGGSRIAFHVLVLIYGLGAAFGAAIRILIGRAIGEGDTSGVRRIWRVGRSTLMVPAILVGLALILLRVVIAPAFTQFPDVREQIEQALVMVGLIVPLVGWNLSNVCVIRAFGRTKLDMYGNVVAAVVVQLPVAWLFGEVFGLGVTGAFIGMAAYWVLRGALLEIWARRCLRETDNPDQTAEEVMAER